MVTVLFSGQSSINIATDTGSARPCPDATVEPGCGTSSAPHGSRVVSYHVYGAHSKTNTNKYTGFVVYIPSYIYIYTSTYIYIHTVYVSHFFQAYEPKLVLHQSTIYAFDGNPSVICVVVYTL